MKRSDKAAQITALNERWQPVKNAILVGFSGLTVMQVNELRRKVRDASSSYLVVKNRLAVRAVEGTPLERLARHFEGPTAVAFNDNEPVGLAKLLSEFAKDNPALTFKVGLIEGKDVLDVDGLKALASLPGLLELRARLLSVIQTPATQLVRLLSTPATQLARVLEARREKLSESAQE